MLKLIWHTTTIKTNKQANDMVSLFKSIQPKIGGFDTETTGLHIITDKPFLFQFGFIHPNMKEGYSYVVDIEKQPNLSRAVIKVWNKLAEKLEIYLAHNIKFDLNMLENYGEPYRYENVSDTMFYIRYAHDALTPANGGPPLGLKEYANKYIDGNAKYHEKLLQNEKTDIVKELNSKLKMRLGITLKEIKDIFSDKILDYSDLKEPIRTKYLDWLSEDVPIYIQPKVDSLITPDMIPYNVLNRENIIKYGHYDIIYLLEIYLTTAPVVQARGNQIGIEFENKLIYPLLEMERTGFNVDKDYIETSRIKLKNYIIQRRAKLQEISGQAFSIGQHALIKEIFKSKFGIELISTNSDEIDLLKSQLIREGGHEEAVEFIDLIQELRTLEKWYSTYIIRFKKDLVKHDRLYTTINQVGTVSGRVTSDFQQFPKDGILSVDGEELFKPRRMIKTTGGKYNAIVYLDFSQIELRFQALYTILVGHPDTNLCRAYMPYKCINNDGIRFDYSNPDHIRHWEDEWYYEENPTEHWVATDVHGATTEHAFGITKEHPDFKKLRYIGKRVNFAKNYGAQRGKIRQMFPEYDEEQITKIDEAYYKAFPGVKQYHEYCYQRASYYAYTQNLFGIKYYGVNGHKLINMLVQGSAAFYLKMKIRELYEFRHKHNLKTRIQMQIHDELSWEYNSEDDPKIFFEFQKIMQDWDDALVPIVADMEVTTTTWAEKKDVNNLEELKEKLAMENS